MYHFQLKELQRYKFFDYQQTRHVFSGSLHYAQICVGQVFKLIKK